MYDMHMLGDISKLVPSLSFDGSVNTGMLKASQRYLVLLLTDVETDRFGRGTRIPKLLGQANLNLASLEGAFRIAATDVIEQMQSTYTSDTPAEEKISTAEVAITVENDRISATVSLTNAEGNTADIILPQNFEDLKKE